MGIDAGFDMVPCLSKGVVDRHNWDQFISFIKHHYRDDPQVEIKPNYILFKAGEHPKLPFEGHKFLRFSSKISGANAAATNAESYINTTTRIAKVHFGSRVQYWNEFADQYGDYVWNEVDESIRSYEQLDKPEIHTSIACLLTGSDPIKEVDISMFEVKSIPGKGQGLIARLNISKGTQILCEKPLLTARSMAPSELELILAAKLKSLPKASQRQYLSLHNNNNLPRKYPFTNIFKTNALPCGEGSVVGGTYPTICLINHSCIPNSHNSWDSNAKHETIYAIRPIKVGEEITIPYGEADTSAKRSAFLKVAFGFDCNCYGCSRPSSELQASDARRLRIQSLNDAIGDPLRMASRPKESLRDCHSLLKALEDEFDGYAGILNARLYYDALQVSIAHGDQARASVFAERAYKARIVCEGKDSLDAQKMQALARKPADHRSFGGCSMKWKTTRGMVPKGLNTTQFEAWLFRM